MLICKLVNYNQFPEVSTNETDNMVAITGNGFSITFNKTEGVISSFKKGDIELVENGFVPNFWRAPTDNDFGNNLHRRNRVWRDAGKNRKVTSVTVNNLIPSARNNKQTSENLVNVIFTYDLFDEVGEKIADYKTEYTVYGSGDVQIANHFKMAKKDLPEIVRMGMNIVMPRKFDQMAWLGRGPHESYSDRKTSAFVGLYSGNVADQYWAYLRPQENGNKTDVRWLAITDVQGNGLFFQGMQLLEVSAHHNLQEDFESMEPTYGQRTGGNKANRHTTDVKPRDLTSVNIDFKQMGVGGDNSWGARTHEQYRLTDNEYSYSFRMKGILSGDDPVKIAKEKL
jgi:beta-galactosidase